MGIQIDFDRKTFHLAVGIEKENLNPLQTQIPVICYASYPGRSISSLMRANHTDEPGGVVKWIKANTGFHLGNLGSGLQKHISLKS